MALSLLYSTEVIQSGGRYPLSTVESPDFPLPLLINNNDSNHLFDLIELLLKLLILKAILLEIIPKTNLLVNQTCLAINVI